MNIPNLTVLQTILFIVVVVVLVWAFIQVFPVLIHPFVH